jgi:hypothetical protein
VPDIPGLDNPRHRTSGIETLAGGVDPFQVTSLDRRPRTLPQEFPKHLFDERGPGLLGARHAFDGSQYVSRECDGCLLFHSTIITSNIWDQPLSATTVAIPAGIVNGPLGSFLRGPKMDS